MQDCQKENQLDLKKTTKIQPHSNALKNTKILSAERRHLYMDPQKEDSGDGGRRKFNDFLVLTSEGKKLLEKRLKERHINHSNVAHNSKLLETMRQCLDTQDLLKWKHNRSQMMLILIEGFFGQIWAPIEFFYDNSDI